MKKIVISGGSGLVGSALTKLLVEKKYHVVHLSRQGGIKGGITSYEWDYEKNYINLEALQDAHAIVHLAGAGIADKRWSAERKKVIVDSRVKTAELLFRAAEEARIKPEVFVSSSGMNYYGSTTSTKTFRETDPPSGTFIGQCCVEWEDAARKFESLCRVVCLRTSVVLSEKGGALEKIDKPVRLGVGAALGSGKQFIPYIHLKDLARLYLFAIENTEMTGSFNASNGDHITNKTLTQAIAKSLDKPLWLPNVPSTVLKLALGEMSEIILEGSKASAQKVMDAGFHFQYPDLSSALSQIYSRKG